MEQIEPGSKVKVTIKRTPLGEGARKTLARLFLKDRRIAKARRRTPKPTLPKRRGGRIWLGRAQGAVTTVPRVGDSCEIACTLDVVRDLGSVKRYVDVSPV
jgi:hypothetical protein